MRKIKVGKAMGKGEKKEEWKSQGRFKLQRRCIEKRSGEKAREVGSERESWGDERHVAFSQNARLRMLPTTEKD